MMVAALGILVNSIITINTNNYTYVIPLVSWA
eukprot:SAG31_NODE_20268_length_579_cov_0.856250_1_plen_31_part_01